MSKLLGRASKSLARTAIVSNKHVFTYESVLTTAESIHARLAQNLPGGGRSSSSGGTPPRVGLYAAPGPEYLAATWAVWQAGGIVVPLATSHPPPELSYVCQDAGVSVVLCPPDQEAKLGPVAQQHGAKLQLLDPAQGGRQLATGAGGSLRAQGLVGQGQGHGEAGGVPDLLSDLGESSTEGALIIYTSGTTGKPKGVLHTHRSLHAQVGSLASAWRMHPHDTLLHTLPLHHIHGIVNALYTPAAVGAAVEVMARFSPTAVWERLESGDISVFMGVPTMYAYLLSHYDSLAAAGSSGSSSSSGSSGGGAQGDQGPPGGRQAALRAAAAGLRLAISGSSACPVPIMDRWRALSGRNLLERYGMTEIGMALSNPYEGERRPGSVGVPLPGVEVRVGADGQLGVRGPTVFREYWGREAATREAFDEDGFFLTGDTASLGGSPPYYTIEGRTSVDILKSSGYKISALQVESAIMEHPSVGEVAVLGVPHPTFGEVVTALVAPAAREGPAAPLDEGELQRHCRERLAPYQVPKRWQWVSSLPRNAMGKVNKKELLRLMQEGKLQ